MNTKLTPEQRLALDQQQGKPVYVIDEDRQEAFVLLPADDYERIRSLVEPSPVFDEWTTALNRRRCELIDRDVTGLITPQERIELAELQWRANRYFDEIAAPRMQQANALLQQLLEQADDHQ